MRQKHSKPVSREIEVEIKIGAAPDAVWQALTDAEELTCWFPMAAEVTPGPGGSMWTSWGEGFEWESKIEIWEPNRCLRLVYPQPITLEDPETGQDALQNEKEHGPAPVVATDCYLKGQKGATILRLVHSGFSTDPAFDDLFEATRRGWEFQLRSLRHYLERHRGTKRNVASIQMALDDITIEAAWRRLMSPLGLLKQGKLPAPTREGAPYAFTTATGDAFSGSILTYNPPYDFSGTVKNLNDGIIRVWLDPPLILGGQSMAYFWLSTYDISPSQLHELRERWERFLRILFALDGKSLH